MFSDLCLVLLSVVSSRLDEQQGYLDKDVSSDHTKLDSRPGAE
jgi:hypothetical protein